MKTAMLSLRGVFSNTFYLVFAFVCAFGFLVFESFISNFSLMENIIFGLSAPVWVKLKLVFYIFAGFLSGAFVSYIYMNILAAFLFGINSALIVYLLRNRAVAGFERKPAVAGLIGTLTGVLGIGCAACGSYILNSILSFGGAVGLISFLPLRGAEFSIAAVILLSLSIYWTARAIARPLICEV